MMGDVIKFKKKGGDVDTWSGPVFCVSCKHEFEGEGEIGEMFIDCVACHRVTATPKYPFLAEAGDEVFSCACESEALTAYKRGGYIYIRCISCGNDCTEGVFLGIRGG